MQNDVRTLRIDPTVTSPVPEYVFGHNLEHTRACVSGGLSAQMLRNRKFAGRPQARLGVAAEWFPIGDTVYFCNDTSPYVRHEKANGMWRRNDLNAQTIQNAVDGQTAGIGQDGLRFQSGKEYLFALTAKSASPVEMTISSFAAAVPHSATLTSSAARMLFFMCSFLRRSQINDLQKTSCAASMPE